MVSSHHHRPNASHHIPRYLAFLFCFYLAFAAPAANAIAGALAGGSAVAAAAASALGAAEGLAIPAATGALAAAAAVAAFAIPFCVTSMALGDNLCTPEDPDTGGGIARALENPSASTQYIWATGAGQQSDFIFATAEAAGRAMCAYYNESYVSLYNITLTGSYVHCRRSDGSEDNWDVRAKPNPNYDPNGPAFNPPDVAGDNIAGNPRAAAGIGAAAAAKARGASDSAANAAAHAAAAATGTGNPARANAAGNTAAAAGAAAAAAEAAGGSAEDVKKAARDAANTAAAAADKAQPDEKTCQSNGASVDGRYCTDATAQPKPNSVPVFCTWALVVCTFIDWVKDEPATATAQETAVEPEKDSYDNYDLPSNPHKQVNITFGGQCPSDVTIPVFMCIEWNFSYHAACEIAGYAKYAFIGVASITAVFIVTGNRESE